MAKGTGSFWRWGGRWAAFGAAGLAACALATVSLAGSSTIVIATVQPFSGPDAFYGPNEIAGCYPAARLINAAGGVLGKNVSCIAVDSKGDPADAVPAVVKMIATTSNLVGVLGPSSDEATATVPSLNRAKIVTVGNTGEAAFDHSSFQYFWRNTPPDDANGTAMGLAAYRAGYRRVALVFGSDTAAQGLVPTAKSAFAKLGGKIVSNQSLDPQETSYRTEIVKMLAAKPQAILTEMDPQASATFFSELKQLHGLIPVIGSAVAEEAPWIKAVGGAVGMSQVHRYITGVRAHGPTKGAAWKVWNKSLLASAKNVPKPRQWSYDPYSMAAYDATNMMALAMIAAKNTKPSVYNSFILDVTSAGAGKVEVGTFAAGKKALLAGKRIEYIGPTGPMAFNRWHNSTGAFELDVIATNGKLIPTKVFTAAQLAALTG